MKTPAEVATALDVGSDSVTHTCQLHRMLSSASYAAMTALPSGTFDTVASSLSSSVSLCDMKNVNVPEAASKLLKLTRSFALCHSTATLAGDMVCDDSPLCVTSMV